VAHVLVVGGPVSNSPEHALTGPFMPVPVPHPLRRTIETLLIAGTGGFLFDLAKFPAGWLAGAMVLTATAALVGRPLGLPDNLARAFYIVLGMSIGAVATPQTVAGMAIWPLSIVAVTIAMGAGTFGTVVYLKRVHGWDTLTAVLGGLPGGLSQVMVLAAEQGLDLRAIAIVQSMRVIILAVCVPAGLGLFGLAGPVRLPAGSVAIADAPWELVTMVGLSVAVALVAVKSGFPGGLIFGPMVVSGILHGGDFIHIAFPPWFTNLAMVGLGSVAGSRFTGTPFRLILSYLGAGIGSFLVSVAITAAFGLAVTVLLSLHISDVIVAYAPGSIDAMMILALALHLDPVFVGAHHLARVFAVTLALPILVRALAPAVAKKTKSGRPLRSKVDGFGD
jgi:membrane AbrB-like protein